MVYAVKIAVLAMQNCLAKGQGLECSAVIPLAVPPSTVVTLIRLYPLYCTLYLCTPTLTRRHLQALVALSFALVSDIFAPILQCTLHWLQLR